MLIFWENGVNEVHIAEHLSPVAEFILEQHSGEDTLHDESVQQCTVFENYLFVVIFYGRYAQNTLKLFLRV